MSGATDPVVDLLFEVSGGPLPADSAEAVCRAVVAVLPWLADVAGAGIHPVSGAPTDRGTLLLSRRSRLTLRLPGDRAAEAKILAGRTLDVGGASVTVGAAREKPLVPFTTLYSKFVETGSAGEEDFLRDVTQLLGALGTQARFLAGKPRRMRVGEAELGGYSLMLHEVRREESIRLQQLGLGRNRLLGCGIMVPHKSVRAVRVED